MNRGASHGGGKHPPGVVVFGRKRGPILGKSAARQAFWRVGVRVARARGGRLGQIDRHSLPFWLYN